MSYSVILKTLRKQKKLTQKEVASICDITSTYLSKIENNTKTPSMVLLKQLADVYDVPLSIINYLAIDENKIPNKNNPQFKKLKALIDKMVDYLFLDGSYELDEYLTDLKNIRKLKADLRLVESSKSKNYNNVISKPAKASEGKTKYGKRKKN